MELSNLILMKTLKDINRDETNCSFLIKIDIDILNQTLIELGVRKIQF